MLRNGNRINLKSPETTDIDGNILDFEPKANSKFESEKNIDNYKKYKQYSWSNRSNNDYYKQANLIKREYFL